MDEIIEHPISNDKPKQRLRKWQKWTLVVLSLLLFYAVVIEPQWLQVERVEIRLPRLPEEFDGFTIVQMSDIHYSKYTWPGKTRAAVRLANDAHPDLIVLTGDYIIRQAVADSKPCARILGGLRATDGVFAVLGNHDLWTNPEAVTDALMTNGIRVMVNESEPITREKKRLWIAGLDDAWSGIPDPAAALAQVPPDDPAVLLVHEPDFADEAALYPVDLQLSGHSHGGQVRIPLLGALVTPYMGEKYRYGLYTIGRIKVYVTRGVGTVGPPPLRFYCRPEVTVITLRAGST